MRLLRARILVPVAMVVVAWGGAHLLVSHDGATVTPAAWPLAAPASPASQPPAFRAAPTAPASPTAGAGGVPILPGALQQLNGDTRDTAIGLYALIQQLEGALRDHLDQLVGQLEPGR